MLSCLLNITLKEELLKNHQKLGFIQLVMPLMSACKLLESTVGTRSTDISQMPQEKDIPMSFWNGFFFISYMSYMRNINPLPCQYGEINTAKELHVLFKFLEVFLHNVCFVWGCLKWEQTHSNLRIPDTGLGTFPALLQNIQGRRGGGKAARDEVLHVWNVPPCFHTRHQHRSHGLTVLSQQPPFSFSLFIQKVKRPYLPTIRGQVLYQKQIMADY